MKYEIVFRSNGIVTADSEKEAKEKLKAIVEKMGWAVTDVGSAILLYDEGEIPNGSKVSTGRQEGSVRGFDKVSEKYYITTGSSSKIVLVDPYDLDVLQWGKEA